MVRRVIFALLCIQIERHVSWAWLSIHHILVRSSCGGGMEPPERACTSTDVMVNVMVCNLSQSKSVSILPHSPCGSVLKILWNFFPPSPTFGFCALSKVSLSPCFIELLRILLFMKLWTYIAIFSIVSWSIRILVAVVDQITLLACILTSFVDLSWKCIETLSHIPQPLNLAALTNVTLSLSPFVQQWLFGALFGKLWTYIATFLSTLKSWSMTINCFSTLDFL